MLDSVVLFYRKDCMGIGLGGLIIVLSWRVVLWKWLSEQVWLYFQSYFNRSGKLKKWMNDNVSNRDLARGNIFRVLLAQQTVFRTGVQRAFLASCWGLRQSPRNFKLICLWIYSDFKLQNDKQIFFNFFKSYTEKKRLKKRCEDLLWAKP